MQNSEVNQTGSVQESVSATSESHGEKAVDWPARWAVKLAAYAEAKKAEAKKAEIEQAESGSKKPVDSLQKLEIDRDALRSHTHLLTQTSDKLAATSYEAAATSNKLETISYSVMKSADKLATNTEVLTANTAKLDEISSKLDTILSKLNGNMIESFSRAQPYAHEHGDSATEPAVLYQLPAEDRRSALNRKCVSQCIIIEPRYVASGITLTRSSSDPADRHTLHPAERPVQLSDLKSHGAAASTRATPQAAQADRTHEQSMPPSSTTASSQATVTPRVHFDLPTKPSEPRLSYVEELTHQERRLTRCLDITNTKIFTAKAEAAATSKLRPEECLRRCEKAAARKVYGLEQTQLRLIELQKRTETELFATKAEAEHAANILTEHARFLRTRTGPSYISKPIAAKDLTVALEYLRLIRDGLSDGVHSYDGSGSTAADIDDEANKSAPVDDKAWEKYGVHHCPPLNAPKTWSETSEAGSDDEDAPAEDEKEQQQAGTPQKLDGAGASAAALHRANLDRKHFDGGGDEVVSRASEYGSEKGESSGGETEKEWDLV